MSTPFTLPVDLTFESGYPPGTGTAVVVDRDVRTRVRRAASIAALCFGFAFLGVFVPLMHLILPPTFIITGIVLGILRLRETRSLVEVRTICPRCREQKVVPGGGPFRSGRTLRCNQCAEQMTLTAHVDAPP